MGSTPTGHAPKGREKKMKALSPETITSTRDSIAASGGNMVKAAKDLGITRQALHQRIQTHPACWPDTIVRKRYGTLRGVNNETIQEALKANGGVVSRTAEALGVSAPTLRNYLKANVPATSDGVAEVSLPPHRNR